MLKKLFTIALIATLVMLLASCGGAPATEAPAEVEAPAEEVEALAEEVEAPAEEAEAPAEEAEAPAEEAGPVTITVFAPQDPSRDMATNTFSTELEEMFNAKFDWQLTTYDGNSAKEKRNLALASGDYPEAFMLIPWIDQFTQVDLLKYGEQGVIIPLNDLIDEHAPNIKKAMEEEPMFKAMATAPDGTIWGLPQLIQCYHCSYGNKYWINSYWLDELGLEMPTTTDEFKAVLEAFKTQDPNGNGEADEIPLSGAIMDYGTRPIPFLMNGFIYDDDRTYLIMQDGKVDIAANKPEWKEGLAYIKSLYDEGLIDPGAFTNNAEAYSALGNNADAELIGVGAGMHPWIFVDCADGQPYCSHYDPLPPLQGPNAGYGTYIPNMVPGATFVLTEKASPEAQIAAIKMIDYMFTMDGHLRGIFGEKDVNWREPEAGELANNQNVEPLYYAIPDSPVNNSWGAGAQYWDTVAVRDAQVQSPDIYTAAGYEHRLQVATDLYNGKESEYLFPFWLTWPDPVKADEVAMQRTNIVDYVNQNSLAFITGSKDLDSEWDAYVEGLEGLGLADYLDSMQKAYDAAQ